MQAQPACSPGVAGRARWPGCVARLLVWAAATLALFLGAGAGALAQAQTSRNVVALPQLGTGPVDMRVAYVVNPRLHRMDARQLAIALDAVREATLAHFGVELRFAPVVEIPIDQLFATIPARHRRQAMRDVFDFKTGKGDVARLERAFGEGLRDSGESLQAMGMFAEPHTGTSGQSAAQAGFSAFGARIARLHLERIGQWRGMRALDGGSVIDDKPYNEFTMWLALGYGDLPYELVLTNQIIASIEYVHPAVHAAVRGGYSNGLTSYSRLSRFKTFSVWSTFAFNSDDEWLKSMRAGESYSPDEAARLAGLSAAHEIGHQLFHFLHPFGQSACLMNPVPMFSYREWASRLSARDCLIGSSPAMTPGAYKFRY